MFGALTGPLDDEVSPFNQLAREIVGKPEKFNDRADPLRSKESDITKECEIAVPPGAQILRKAIPLK